MKKVFILFCLGTFITANRVWADTVQEGQSTEGKDFWVTFLQADQDANNDLTQSLSFSSRENCEVTVTQPFTGWDTTLNVNANQLVQLQLYSGNVIGSTARAAQAQSGIICYSVNSQKVDTCALHVTASANIAVFATSYKKATFDATNVLPTASLLDEYVIQTYTPSDHGGVSSTQGSHFCIVAAENNVIVDYIPTVETQAVRNAKTRQAGGYSLTHEDSLYLNWQQGDTMTTPILKKGQVYYVWTGKADDEIADISGTWVKARDNKKIAVFQGCPHTNIPYQTKERDHIFSQAMPTQYWGNTFAVTASNGRGRDIYRIMALNDETEVYLKGVAADGGDSLVYTFDFASNPKHYWEFEIGKKGIKPKTGRWKDQVLPDPLIANTDPNNNNANGIITTSCPCALHLFLTSKNYDNVSDGDPAMLWVNPIEQQIDHVTFATYSSKNGTTAHNVNIVTANPDSMYLDGSLMSSSEFTQMPYSKSVSGEIVYYFAQKSLGSVAATHTLQNTNGSFIAHVYGFTSNESYGFSAGGATKSLAQYIIINGDTLRAGQENNLCGKDSVHFSCRPDYEYEKIVWDFGDGIKDSTEGNESVIHIYPTEYKTYNASCTIRRSSSNLCKGEKASVTIPIIVNIGTIQIGVKGDSIPRCSTQGSAIKYYIFLDNPSKTDLKTKSIISFDSIAQHDGFDDSKLTITKDTFIIDVPSTAQEHKYYGIHVFIDSKCKDSQTDTTITFQIEYYKNYVEQRFRTATETVIGIDSALFNQQATEPYDYLSNFVWTVNDVVIPNQQNSVLHLQDGGDIEAEYMVCFTLHKSDGADSTICSCPIKINPNKNDTLEYVNNSEAIVIQVNCAQAGDQVFVNALEEGTATWYSPDGNVFATAQLPKGGGLIKAPNKAGLYVLKVDAGHQRTFKFIVK